MGFFNKFLKSETTGKGDKNLGTNNVPWILLHDLETIDKINSLSNSRLQVIFKHSTRCGISRMVLKNFETNYTSQFGGVDFYLLDLLNYRDLSAKIASQFDVVHESPQFIAVKNETVVHHASHSDIAIDSLAKYL
ncbi:bacillithiol system redox-active protein YtxJ [Aquimarina sp. W85]|uniref:bacillithiol system redox-active protein YtxJ n=1 Tax=Aquimarina rhodophyticola TaxID=3342246 RepID=UPI0036700D8A